VAVTVDSIAGASKKRRRVWGRLGERMAVGRGKKAIIRMSEVKRGRVVVWGVSVVWGVECVGGE
jgi:hypothetical protein